MNEIEAYYALTQKTFNFLAPIYNGLTLPLARVRNQAVDFVKECAGVLVLDVATGTGQQVQSTVFMMHPGMDGQHDYAVHLKTNDPQNPDLVVHVLSNWGP